MNKNARKAFEELKALGVWVYEWGPEDGYPEDTAFVFIWENDDTGEVFFDDTRQYIREEYEDGRFINPFGFRQDVHAILARNKLVTENHGGGQVVVYNDPNTIGLNHAREAERNRFRNQ